MTGWQHSAAERIETCTPLPRATRTGFSSDVEEQRIKYEEVNTKTSGGVIDAMR